jgi:hypothetical protein
MKKIMLSLMAVFAAGSIQASSIIDLPGGGEVPVAGGTTGIVLTPLIPDVAYDVTCKITNPNAEKVDMHFEISEKTASWYNLFVLNGDGLTSGVGGLKPGDNTVSIAVQTSTKQVTTLVMKNLDSKNTVTVSNCSGKPRQNIESVGGQHSGWFYATNNTSYGVTLRVGNVIPTTYVIYPWNFQSIYVSTNNQNIEIADVW